jgi:hypothetical protein
MFWANLPADQLPAPGDLVVFSHQHREYIVATRIKDANGLVWLELEGHGWERVESVSWALHEGCTALVLLKPYLDWFAAQMDWQRTIAEDEPARWQECQQTLEKLRKQVGEVDKANSWIYQDLTVTRIAHGWATVRAQHGPPHQIPTQCLAVLHRAKPQQLKIA